MKLRDAIAIAGAGTAQCLSPGVDRLHCVVDRLEEQVAVLECVVESADTAFIVVPRDALPSQIEEGGMVFVRVED